MPSPGARLGEIGAGGVASSSDSGTNLRPWNSFLLIPGVCIVGEGCLGNDRAALAQERSVVREARRAASLAAWWVGWER